MHQNHIFKYPRDSLTHLLKAGFLKEQPENGKIFLDEFSWWIGKDFFYMILKKKIDASPLPQYFKDQKLENGRIIFSHEVPTLMKYKYIDPRLSWVTLTSIQAATWISRKMNSELIDELTSIIPVSPITFWVYSQDPLNCIELKFQSERDPQIQNLKRSGDEIKLVSAEDGLVYKITVFEKNLDLQTLVINKKCGE